MKNRVLPIGIQSFEKLWRGGYLYVDKTKLMYQLVCTERPYFLARPRRFGKSLLVSTMRAYFEGKKELFEGLWIAQEEQRWETFLVLHIDFSQNGYFTTAELQEAFDEWLTEYEEEYGIQRRYDDPATRFRVLIKTAAQQTRKPVVVLVDEYDKPMLDSLQGSAGEANRMLMRNFYGVLKGCDEYLRFVFLTGVTKFAHINIFSELNHLIDISMDDAFSAICGVTEEELRNTFVPELEALAAKRDEEIWRPHAAKPICLPKRSDGTLMVASPEA